MKFNNNSDEQVCTMSIPHPKYGELICLRIAGHPGECVALMSDASLADGVCFYCRQPQASFHKPNCLTSKVVL